MNKTKRVNERRARCWFSSEEFGSKNTRQKLHGGATDNSQTIRALQSKWGSHNPGRQPTGPEALRKFEYVKIFKKLIPNEFVKEVLRNLHGNCGRHPGITRTKIANKQKHSYPNMAQLTKKWVLLIDQSIKEGPIDNMLHHQSLHNPNEHITGPDEAMQNDSLSQLFPFDGYEDIVTAMNVFSKNLFAYPTTSHAAKTDARLKIQTMTELAYFYSTTLHAYNSSKLKKSFRRLPLDWILHQWKGFPGCQTFGMHLWNWSNASPLSIATTTVHA